MRQKRMYWWLWVLLPAGIGIFTGCAGVRGVDMKPGGVSVTTPAARAMVKTELYFGCSQPDGSEVSEIQWRSFVAKEITPRFRDGLTIIEAYGQWMNGSGKLIREKTKLVMIIHENTSAARDSIEAVRAAYKKRFRQESVLKVTAPIEASF